MTRTASFDVSAKIDEGAALLGSFDIGVKDPPPPLALQPFGLMGEGIKPTPNPAQCRLLIPSVAGRAINGWARLVVNVASSPYSTGGPTAAGMKTLVQAGFAVTLTVRWFANGSAPGTLPTDLVAARAAVDKLLDDFAGICSHVVVEDEENARGQWGSPTATVAQNAADYATWYSVVRASAIAHHMTISDGGLISEMATSLAYQDLVLQGRQADADAFWAKSADSFTSKGQAAQKYADGMTFLNAILSAGRPNFANFHKYVPDRTKVPGADGQYPIIAAFFAKTMGVPPMCNEWGVRDSGVDAVQAAAASIDAANLAMAVCYAGGGGPGNAVSLWNGAVPGPNGQALATYISTH